MKLVKLIIFATVLLTLPHVAFADTWRGTAPFCDGECKSGETLIRRDDCGNGACCWTGSKALCRNSDPLCEPRQTRTSCAGVLQICNDGYYRFPDNWVSCSSYICGGCVGFDWFF